jgi:hypothetical protein
VSIVIGVASCVVVIALLVALLQRDGVSFSPTGWTTAIGLASIILIVTLARGYPGWSAGVILGLPLLILVALTRGHPAAGLKADLLNGSIEKVPGREAWDRMVAQGMNRKQRFVFFLALVLAFGTFAVVLLLAFPNG